MLSIAIETGSYSVKFLHFHNDRKSFHLLKTDEIVIEEKDPDEDPERSFIPLPPYIE